MVIEIITGCMERGPKRFLCQVHFLYIDSGVDYPNGYTSESLNSIDLCILLFQLLIHLKKAIRMRLLKYIGKSNIP